MYVVSEYLGPAIGPIVEDNRPRFHLKRDAVKELRRQIKECKQEYRARYRFGHLTIEGNPWTETVRLTFGCNLWTTLYISES